MILGDDAGVADQQVGLKDIGVGEQMAGHQGGADVIGLIVYGVLQKTDHGVFVEELVELFGQVAPDDVDFVNAGGQAGVNEAVNNPYAADAHEWLRCVEGDGYQAAAKPGGDKYGAFGAVGLQGAPAGVGDRAVFYVAGNGKLFQDRGNHSRGISGFFHNLLHGQRFFFCSQQGENRKLFFCKFLVHGIVAFCVIFQRNFLLNVLWTSSE